MTKIKTEEIMFFIFTAIVICFGIYFLSTYVSIDGGFLGQTNKDMECGVSKYNIYTNSTQGTKYFFGKCYVNDISGYYESKEVCKGGIFGIGQSCYESSETHLEPIPSTICFKLKNGERC